MEKGKHKIEKATFVIQDLLEKIIKTKQRHPKRPYHDEICKTIKKKAAVYSNIMYTTLCDM